MKFTNKNFNIRNIDCFICQPESGDEESCNNDVQFGSIVGDIVAFSSSNITARFEQLEIIDLMKVILIFNIPSCRTSSLRKMEALILTRN
jgi:hypothetical protein